MCKIAYLDQLCTKLPKYFYFFIYLSQKSEILSKKIPKIEFTPPLQLGRGE